MDCPNHKPVSRRMLEFDMHEDPKIPGHLIRSMNRHQASQTVIAHQDGTGCPACDSFQPTSARVERTR